MPEATETELKELISGLDNVNSDTIQLYLSSAKSLVIGHGIGVTNSRFSEMQMYLAAHLMTTSGIASSSGPIESERVADVSISYGGNSSNVLGSLYSTNWEREFQKIKNQIQGLDNRCL